MPPIIDDKTLARWNMTEQQARVEIACRLYDAEKVYAVEAEGSAQLHR